MRRRSNARLQVPTPLRSEPCSAAIVDSTRAILQQTLREVGPLRARVRQALFGVEFARRARRRNIQL